MSICSTGASQDSCRALKQDEKQRQTDIGSNEIGRVPLRGEKDLESVEKANNGERYHAGRGDWLYVKRMPMC